MGRRALIWLMAAVAMGVGFAAGFELHSRSVAEHTAERSADQRPLRAQVLAELDTHYYRTLPARVRRATTLRGVLRALDDPYTTYLSPAEHRDLLESQAGGYAGVGLALERDRSGLVVRVSLPGMPAHRAGILPGDVIVTVDDTALSDLPYMDAVGMLHGAPGTPVQLEVRRPGREEPMRLTLERQPVTLSRVEARTISDGSHKVMVITVPAFTEHTAQQVRTAVRRAADRGVDGIVLDLRGNLGGLLSEAVGVVRVFLGQGVIAETGGAHEPEQLLVADGSAIRAAPLVVLIDGTTASAAEVVAGALQLERVQRARVVGTRSFGKGTVQAVHPLPSGGALKLTVATFRLAGGRPVDGHGIDPDVVASDRIATDQDEALQAALRVLDS